jgi:uncharacterized membrane protein YdbT with pleckstrin-like domain
MDLHPGERIVFQGHPSSRASLGYYLPLLLLAVVAGVIVAIAASVALGIAAGVVLLALVLLVGHVKRTATDYVITTQRLYIRRGILSKREQQTRIDRVQNINTHQSLLERMLRVGTVDFDTAGTDDSEFRFVGISRPGAVVTAVDRAQREPDADAPAV